MSSSAVLCFDVAAEITSYLELCDLFSLRGTNTVFMSAARWSLENNATGVMKLCRGPEAIYLKLARYFAKMFDMDIIDAVTQLNFKLLKKDASFLFWYGHEKIRCIILDGRKVICTENLQQIGHTYSSSSWKKLEKYSYMLCFKQAGTLTAIYDDHHRASYDIKTFTNDDDIVALVGTRYIDVVGTKSKQMLKRHILHYKDHGICSYVSREGIVSIAKYVEYLPPIDVCIGRLLLGDILQN